MAINATAVALFSSHQGAALDSSEESDMSCANWPEFRAKRKHRHERQHAVPLNNGPPRVPISARYVHQLRDDGFISLGVS